MGIVVIRGGSNGNDPVATKCRVQTAAGRQSNHEHVLLRSGGAGPRNDNFPI